MSQGTLYKGTKVMENHVSLFLLTSKDSPCQDGSVEILQSNIKPSVQELWGNDCNSRTDGPIQDGKFSAKPSR